MSSSQINSVAAVLLISDAPERMLEFYRDGLGAPLEDEQHGETHLHWGCELGQVHFAIHPKGNFSDLDRIGNGAMRVAFGTDDIAGLAERVARRGDPIVFEPKDLGWCKMMGVRDPDGNVVEVVQMKR
jgi:catechol 2,3-dioxygenase-like lactoylglutathione lyase family enzyme